MSEDIGIRAQRAADLGHRFVEPATIKHRGAWAEHSARPHGAATSCSTARAAIASVAHATPWLRIRLHPREA
jgi:hypothetical protein